MQNVPDLRGYYRVEVWQLAWPMILSNITIPLLGAVDTAILGHLESPTYLGAVAVGASVLTFLFWGFGFLRMGTTSLVARAFGAKDYSRCLQLLQQSIALALALAVILLLIQPLVFPLAMTLMEPSAEVKGWALSYCQIRIYAAPATLVNYAIIGWFIGLQDTRSPLLIMVTTNFLNILLDWLLIMVLGLKSDGAALATVAAEYSSLLLALLLVAKKLRQLPGRLSISTLKQLDGFWELLRVNRHLFVRTATLLFAFAFFTSQGARQGDNILAANAILLQLLMLTAYGLDGFAHAAEALTGKAIGAHNQRNFYRACYASTEMALITALGFTALFVLGQDGLIGLFSNIPAVINTVEQYYAWLCALPLIAAWSYQLDGIFIGAGKTKAMQNTMLAACFGCYLPLWWLTQSQGNHGLWLSFCALNFARSLAMGGMFIWLSRQRRWLEPAGTT